MTQTAEKAVEQLKTLTSQAAQLIQQIQQVEETLTSELNIEGDILTASSKLVTVGDLAKVNFPELDSEKAELDVVSEGFDTSEISSEIDDILAQIVSIDTRIKVDQANVNNLKIETKEILANLQTIVDACGKNYTNSESSF